MAIFDKINIKKTHNKSKYKWILQNLLDVKGRDHSIYTKVNNKTSFEVTETFGESAVKNILKEPSFKITHKNEELTNKLNTLKDLKEAKEIISFCERNNVVIHKTDKANLEVKDTFAETKELIITRFNRKIRKYFRVWTLLNHHVNDINTQENIWTLYMASGYVKLKTKKREILTPLIVKPVTVKVSSANVLTVKALDDWKINEKAIFIINNSINAEYPDDISFKGLSGKEALKRLWEEYDLKPASPESPFTNIEKGNISNTSLEAVPGFVLGTFRPFGTNVRKAMVDIIKNDEMDSIIDKKADLEVSTAKVDEFILKQSKDILRIQPSNFSQSKAIASAILQQDTIIWGPPGTGKSQVISNIIANVLYLNKTAVVMSQKRAALDVLRKRLGEISKYALFVINSKHLNKKDFYKNLEEFISSIKDKKPLIKRDAYEIITQEEVDRISTLHRAKYNEEQFQAALKFVSLIKEWDVSDEKRNATLDSILFLTPSFKYPEYSSNFDKYYEKFKEVNQAKYEANKNLSAFNKLEKITAKKSHEFFGKFKIPNWAELIKYGSQTDINIIKDILRLNDKFSRTKINKWNFTNDEAYLDRKIGKELNAKLNDWKENDKDLYGKFEKFEKAAKSGIRLPHNFVNDHHEVIQKLFPVIITTPDTSFIKWEKHSYDYTIVDESSQIPVETGLPILWLGKTRILAGDPQQMQPTNWFSLKAKDDEEQEETNKPSNLFIKRHKSNESESLLDFCLQKNIYKIMLDKNYRSNAAALMSFSSRHFYDSTLDVLDSSVGKHQTPIEVINVKGEWKRGKNILEAQKVVDTLMQNKDKFQDVIVLSFNSPQSLLIQGMVLEQHPELEDDIESGKISFKNLENIQGDEAELIIVSVIYTSETHMGSTYITHAGGKNALNVALSRAKSKMIVVKSVTDSDIREVKTPDFRVFQSWLDFLNKREKQQKLYAVHPDTKVISTNLGFDIQSWVTKFLKEYPKFIVEDNFEIGTRNIDLVIRLKSTGKFIVGFKIEDYDFEKQDILQEYLSKNDGNNFLKSKGYNIIVINDLDWVLSKQRIKNRFKKILEEHK